MKHGWISKLYRPRRGARSFLVPLFLTDGEEYHQWPIGRKRFHSIDTRRRDGTLKRSETGRKTSCIGVYRKSCVYFFLVYNLAALVLSYAFATFVLMNGGFVFICLEYDCHLLRLEQTGLINRTSTLLFSCMRTDLHVLAFIFFHSIFLNKNGMLRTQR